MADVGGNSSGRSQERYVPSYEALTAPIPVVRDDDGSMIGTRVPRRFPIGDGEETVLVPRRADGSFRTPGQPPPWGAATGAPGAVEQPGPQVRRGSTRIRAVYSVAAAVVTAAAVVLTFVLFSGDEPDDSVQLPQADAATEPMRPRAAPTITLPGLPRVKALQALPGTPSPVLGAVTDAKAAITYVKLGKPWAVRAIPSFSVGQQVGAVRRPPTMAASGPLPGATPASALKTGAEFRKAALSAVRWTIRNHYPAGSRVTWTASQQPATGRGWTFGYRVTYRVQGKARTSQAALSLLDVGRRKPAMLFVTVSDTNKKLWADIAPLVASARAL
ncbi:hypothetical protein OHA77_13540 [Streptosporangium sp. NBC_01639]|uniref:hypothetical protein n=1 Tax=Streptosporangium sp. NBC_01639 TaxID=2975948 RepID=UPI0038688C7A|nr:hypothetical protein OHA77_13540 [Streptosporangium sp. NBC_01639]